MAQRSRFSRWWRTTLLLLALMGAAAVALVVVHGRSADADALFATLPASTGNVVVGRGLGAWMRAMTQLAAQPGAPAELRQFVGELKDQSAAELGFDATSPDAWRNAGFDPSGAVGLAGSGKPDDPFAFAYLPVRDADAARATLTHALEKHGATVTAHTGSGAPAWTIDAPGPAAPGQRVPLAFGQAGRFLVIAAGTAGGDPLAALDAQVSARGLGATPALRAVRAAVGEPWTLFGFCAPALAKQQLTAQRAEAALGAYATRGVGAALQIDDHAIQLRLRALGVDPATQLQLHTPGERPTTVLGAPYPPSLHLPELPLAVARLGANLPELVARVEKSPQGKDDLARARAALAVAGLDLQRDVLDPLDGQLAVAVFPPAPGERSLVDAVVTVGAHHAAAVLAKLGPALGRLAFVPVSAGPGAADPWYEGPGLLLGAHGDALVVLGAGAARREAWRTAIAQGGDPYWAKIPGTARQAFEHGPALYAWADLERAAEQVAHAGVPGAAAGARVMRSLQSMSVGLDARGGVLQLDATLYPPPTGFAQAIAHGPSNKK